MYTTMKSFDNTRVVVVLLLPALVIMLCIDWSECIIQREREALVTFRHSLVDSSNRLSSWVGQDYCHWHGVGCNNVTGHVVKLDLRNSNQGRYPGVYDRSCLTGSEVNPSLTELKYLQYLDLSSNYFSDSQIPKFLGDFNALRYLNLSNAIFAGAVPHSLGNLSTLRQLDLSCSYYNCLSIDNLNWLSLLSALQFLSLSHVDLSQASSHLSQVLRSFPSLSHLNLSGCDLQEFPSALRNSRGLEFPNANQNLSSLETLDLSNNWFSGVLPNLSSQLKNLKHLDLSSSGFSGLIPTSLSMLSTLMFLNLGSNVELNGSIPESFCKSLALRYLDISFNKLSGSIPICLGTSPTLTYVDLSYNQLSGSIPTFLGALRLEELRLNVNRLNRSLPESLGQLPMLTHLDVSHNSLTGVVSEVHFKKLSKLKKLYIGYNSYHFNVNSDWKPPFQLDIISLRSCLVGPGFPVWLKTQKTIGKIDFTNASISDSIPSWLRNLPLTELSLANNQIHGPIPTFQHNSSMDFLDLSNNSISGSIPIDFKDMLPNLQSLFLSNNNITDVISSSFCEMGNLYALDLSNNHFFGGFPQNCWNNSDMVLLDLRNNNLSGVIPSSIGNITSLSSLHLSNNRFYGELPLALKDCMFLRVLDLSYNGFSGNISSIGRISSLEILNLRSNKLDGILIPQLCHLSNLQIVDLAHNNFSGVIPQCFGNFSGMRDGISVEIYIPGYDEKLTEIIKGRKLEYSKTLDFLVNLDLSSNNLGGNIPEELLSLFMLKALNLSNNHLIGGIPKHIGVLRSLESLDLSNNHLSDMIPQRLLELTFISHLNLSYNKLHGQIPSGFQLDTFESSSYMGNSELCGKPLEKKCAQGSLSNIVGDDDLEGEMEHVEFYISMGIGTAVGFCGVFATLVLKKTLRYSYFQCVENVYDVLVMKM